MLQEASGWLSMGSPVLVGVFKRSCWLCGELRQEQGEEEPGDFTLSGWGRRVVGSRWILDRLGQPTDRTPW